MTAFLMIYHSNKSRCKPDNLRTFFIELRYLAGTRQLNLFIVQNVTEPKNNNYTLYDKPPYYMVFLLRTILLCFALCSPLHGYLK